MSNASGWEDELTVLPDVTTDETPVAWGEDDASNDDRLLNERPPHWD